MRSALRVRLLSITMVLCCALVLLVFHNGYVDSLHGHTFDLGYVFLNLLMASNLHPSLDEGTLFRRFIHRMGSKYFMESVAICYVFGYGLAFDSVINLWC